MTGTQQLCKIPNCEPPAGVFATYNETGAPTVPTSAEATDQPSVSGDISDTDQPSVSGDISDTDQPSASGDAPEPTEPPTPSDDTTTVSEAPATRRRTTTTSTSTSDQASARTELLMKKKNSLSSLPATDSDCSAITAEKDIEIAFLTATVKSLTATIALLKDDTIGVFGERSLGDDVDNADTVII